MDRRKVLMIFAAAWCSAALLTWFLYSSAKAPKVEKNVEVQAAARDMAAGTLLQKADLKTVAIREKDVPRTAIFDANLALGRPLLFPVSANEPITSSKIGSTTGAEGVAATIDMGKRAISVPITDTSGVAGLMQPRSHVDVLFTKPGSMTEAITTTVVEDVIVLAIGRFTESTGASGSGGQAAPRTPIQSATLLVTPDQARKLELAKNQGKISLALRNPLDRNTDPNSKAITSRALYDNLPADSRMWQPVNQAKPPKPPAPVKPPEPPPRKIVEVFRGDKHTQQTF